MSEEYGSDLCCETKFIAMFIVYTSSFILPEYSFLIFFQF